jgi:hypothetical protein
MKKRQYRHEECIDRDGRENELTQHIGTRSIICKEIRPCFIGLFDQNGSPQFNLIYC